MLFNGAAEFFMHMAGTPDPMAVLQLWAAVISKLASDCVAGIIEGCADRRRNIAMRRWDYSEKLRQVFDTFSRMEIAYPTRDMLKVLNTPGEFVRLSKESDEGFLPELIANALDLLYIMDYKPRSHEALRQAMEAMSGDEKEVFLATQQILAEEQCVSLLFVEGLVGRNFAKALSFYLLRYRDYLNSIERMAALGQRVHPVDPEAPES